MPVVYQAVEKTAQARPCEGETRESCAKHRKGQWRRLRRFTLEWITLTRVNGFGCKALRGLLDVVPSPIHWTPHQPLELGTKTSLQWSSSFLLSAWLPSSGSQKPEKPSLSHGHHKSCTKILPHVLGRAAFEREVYRSRSQILEKMRLRCLEKLPSTQPKTKPTTHVFWPVLNPFLARVRSQAAPSDVFNSKAP